MSFDKSILDKCTNKDDITNVMNMIIVIDKEKLPEDIRKLIEEHIPKLMQKQLKPSQEQPLQEQPKPLQEQPKPLQEQPKPLQEQPKPLQEQYDQPKHTDAASIDNKLYAIQVGEVVGNIYAGKGKDANK